MRSEGSEQTRELAAQGLAKEATAAAAILLEKRKTAGPELATRIDGVFVAACSGLKADIAAPHLPYGVAWRNFKVFVEGCGETIAEIGDRAISLEAVAAKCGLSHSRPTARRFLRFLGSPEAVVAAADKAGP